MLRVYNRVIDMVIRHLAKGKPQMFNSCVRKFNSLFRFPLFLRFRTPHVYSCAKEEEESIVLGQQVSYKLTEIQTHFTKTKSPFTTFRNEPFDGS